MPTPRISTTAPALIPADPAEEQLIVAARKGSPDAIASLYNRYASHLLRMLRALTGSSHDAEDVVHDLFLGLPESLRSYEHRGQLHAWLRAVAVRIALMKMRVARRRDRHTADAAEGMRVAAPASDPWNAADLEAAIARLPEALRVVVVLRQLEDRSHDEIAEILGIRAGAVRVRYMRALSRLRQILEYGA
jgi:RNA polymerase sigma factor (sigma-70 family)